MPGNIVTNAPISAEKTAAARAAYTEASKLSPGNVIGSTTSTGSTYTTQQGAYLSSSEPKKEVITITNRAGTPQASTSAYVTNAAGAPLGTVNPQSAQTFINQNNTYQAQLQQQAAANYWNTPIQTSAGSITPAQANDIFTRADLFLKTGINYNRVDIPMAGGMFSQYVPQLNAEQLSKLRQSGTDILSRDVRYAPNMAASNAINIGTQKQNLFADVGNIFNFNTSLKQKGGAALSIIPDVLNLSSSGYKQIQYRLESTNSKLAYAPAELAGTISSFVSPAGVATGAALFGAGYAITSFAPALATDVAIAGTLGAGIMGVQSFGAGYVRTGNILGGIGAAAPFALGVREGLRETPRARLSYEDIIDQIASKGAERVPSNIYRGVSSYTPKTEILTRENLVELEPTINLNKIFSTTASTGKADMFIAERLVEKIPGTNKVLSDDILRISRITNIENGKGVVLSNADDFMKLSTSNLKGDVIGQYYPKTERILTGKIGKVQLESGGISFFTNEGATSYLNIKTLASPTKGLGLGRGGKANIETMYNPLESGNVELAGYFEAGFTPARIYRGIKPIWETTTTDSRALLGFDKPIFEGTMKPTAVDVLDLGSAGNPAKDATVLLDIESKRWSRSVSFGKRFEFGDATPLQRARFEKLPYIQANYNEGIPTESFLFKKLTSTGSLAPFGRQTAYNEAFRVLDIGGQLDVLTGIKPGKAIINRYINAGFTDVKVKEIPWKDESFISSDYLISGKKPATIENVGIKYGIQKDILNQLTFPAEKFTSRKIGTTISFDVPVKMKQIKPDWQMEFGREYQQGIFRGVAQPVQLGDVKGFLYDIKSGSTVSGKLPYDYFTKETSKPSDTIVNIGGEQQQRHLQVVSEVQKQILAKTAADLPYPKTLDLEKTKTEVVPKSTTTPRLTFFTLPGTKQTQRMSYVNDFKMVQTPKTIPELKLITEPKLGYVPKQAFVNEQTTAQITTGTPIPLIPINPPTFTPGTGIPFTPPITPPPMIPSFLPGFELPGREPKRSGWGALNARYIPNLRGLFGGKIEKGRKSLYSGAEVRGVTPDLAKMLGYKTKTKRRKR